MKPKQTKSVSTDRLNKTIEELRATNRELRAKLKAVTIDKDDITQRANELEGRASTGAITTEVFDATSQDHRNQSSTTGALFHYLGRLCVEESGKLELEQRRRHAAVVLGVKQPYNILIDPQI